MPDSQYNVNILIRSTDQTSKPASKATKQLTQLKKAAAAAAVAFGVLKTAQKAVEFVKTGAQIQRQENALNNLAKAAGTSGNAIIGSMRAASDFTIDRMAAMQSANRAMIMDVAETPAQFERLTKVAIALGRAMGVDATTSIDNFVTAAGRQSRLVADNLGLIVRAEDAYARYADQLGTTADQLTDTEKKQAFLNEMLVQGEAKMADLGVQTLDTAGSFEQIEAAIKDAKDGLAVVFAEMAAGSLGTERFLAQIRNIPVAFKQVVIVGKAVTAFLRETRLATITATSPVDAFKNSIKQSMAAMEGASHASELLRFAHYRLEPAIEEVAETVDVFGSKAMSAAMDLEELRNKYNPLKMATEDATRAAQEHATALAEEQAATAAASIALLDLGAALMEADKAQTASLALGELRKAYEAGDISLADFETALKETQIAFGLATPESYKMATGIGTLIEALGSGELKATSFDNAMLLMTNGVTEAQNAIDLLSDSIRNIPPMPGYALTPEMMHMGQARGGIAPGAPGSTTTYNTGGNTTTYNVTDPTAAAILQDEMRRASRGLYVQSAGGG